MGIVDKIRQRYNRLQDKISAHYETYILTILCVYGMTVHFSPSQIFVLEYITEETGLNISSADALGEITPIRTYSFLFILLPVILLTDIVRYKPALYTQVTVYVFAYSVTLAASSVGTLQFAEFLFGMGWALQVTQLSYGLASLHSGLYKKLTGYTYGYILISRCLASVIGQLHVSITQQTSVKFLNITSLVFAVISLIWVVILPAIPRQRFVVTSSGIVPVTPIMTIHNGHMQRPPKNIQIPNDSTEGESNTGERNRTSSESANLNNSQSEQITDMTGSSGFTEIEDLPEEDLSPIGLTGGGRAVLQLNPDALASNPDDNQNSHLDSLSKESKLAHFCKDNFRPIWQDFSRSYGNSYILKWSLWWGIMTSVFIQITWYAPELWEEITSSSNKADFVIRKGSVDAVAYFLAAIGAFFCAHVKLNWRVLCDIIVTILGFTSGILWIMTSQLSSIWLAYVCYTLFVVFHLSLLTVASFEIAGQLTTGKFAFVFGFNNFMAGTLHMLMMILFIVMDRERPDYRTQMLMNGIYVLLVAVGFLANIFYQMGTVGFHLYVHNLKQQRYQELHIENTNI